jgi:sugar lactone lactonase YvrE/5-hydroxyisourate hydrolase-like protein (transthyretin family)
LEDSLRLSRRLLIPPLAATVGLASALALAAAPATAHADTIGTLSSFTGFYQLVANSKYLFISEGVNSPELQNGNDNPSGLIVTDLSGHYVTTLDAGDGVEGIALSPDGTTLYAALADKSKDEIAALDVATITAAQPTQAFYPLPSTGQGLVPYGLAVQSGKLWVSSDLASAQGGTLGYFDLSASTPAYAAAGFGGSWYSAPDLAADPSGKGLVVAAQPGSDPTTALAFDATTGTVLAGPGQLTVGTESWDTCGFEYQLAVIPGSQKFAVACSEQGDYIFTTGNLASPAGSVGSGGAFTAAVAVSPDGTVAAAGPMSASTDSSTADIYQPDGTEVNDLTLGSRTSFPDDPALAPGGLALSPDDSQLFAVLGGGGSYVLQVLDRPTVTRSTLSLSAQAQVLRGSPISATGTLDLTTGGALPAGTDVTVTATGPNGVAGTPQTVPASADGSFTFTAPTSQQTATGDYTYTASYAGDPDANISGSTASATVNVTVTGDTLTLTGPAVVPPGKSFTLSGLLDFYQGTPATGTPITVKRVNPDHTTTTITGIHTGANGSFSISDKLSATGSYSYSASYAGSLTTAAATSAHQLSIATIAPTLTLSTGASTALYDSTINVTAHLGSTDTNRTVSVYYQLVGSGTRKLIKTARVNASGNLTVSYPSATRNVIFTTVFSGDAQYNARSVSDRIGVDARVAMTNSGWYTSVKYNGVEYRVYHHSGHLNFAVTVTPNKRGETVKLVGQQWYQNAWTTVAGDTFAFSLNSSSKVSDYLSLAQATGGYFRVRAVFYPSSKDVTNVSYYSGWFYFHVVS